MYRDDSEATRARIGALEADLRATRRTIAERERAIAEGCKSRDHLAAMKRVAELEAKVAKANQPHTVPPRQAALERELDDLRVELDDLRLLARGDDAIQVEIDKCRLAVTDAQSEVEKLRAERALRQVPGTTTVEGELRLGWAISLALGELPFWSRQKMVVRPEGISVPDKDEFPGTCLWPELAKISFRRDKELRLHFKFAQVPYSATLRFRTADPGYSAIARAVLAAAKRLGFRFRGQVPDLSPAEVHQ